MSQLVYVTTGDCHFCEHGRDILDDLGVERREIADSSEEAAVLAERGLPLSFLPVLTDGQRVIAMRRRSPGGHSRGCTRLRAHALGDTLMGYRKGAGSPWRRSRTASPT